MSSKLLVTNKIQSTKSINNLIEKFIKLKTRKLSKLKKMFKFKNYQKIGIKL